MRVSSTADFGPRFDSAKLIESIRSAERQIRGDKPIRVSAYTTDINGNVCRSVRMMKPSQIRKGSK